MNREQAKLWARFTPEELRILCFNGYAIHHKELCAFADGAEIEYSRHSNFRLARKLEDPSFCQAYYYRAKQSARIINGFEVPEPVRKPPKDGQIYFLSSTTDINFVSARVWRGNSRDFKCLELGLIHLAGDPAMSNTKAMLGINPWESEA